MQQIHVSVLVTVISTCWKYVRQPRFFKNCRDTEKKKQKNIYMLIVFNFLIPVLVVLSTDFYWFLTQILFKQDWKSILFGVRCIPKVFFVPHQIGHCWISVVWGNCYTMMCSSNDLSLNYSAAVCPNNAISVSIVAQQWPLVMWVSCLRGKMLQTYMALRCSSLTLEHEEHLINKKHHVWSNCCVRNSLL
jgi:hypothetical protein